MKKKIAMKVFISLLLLTFLSNVSNAQKNTLVINFKIAVKDSLTQNSIPYATIKLLNNDNNVVKVFIANDEGQINFSCNISTENFLLLTATGYVSKKIALSSITTNSELYAATILLTQQITTLKEAVVKSTTPLIKQDVDRIIYNLQADPDGKVKNMLEMLRKMPYLSVDAEENILLKGNKNFKIFINGKPSSLMENNAKEVLRSMPASTIQRIEIITNPSAKYDAEGVSGIINIITSKKINDGYNATINLYHRMPIANSGIGTSFTTKSGKLGLSSFAGLNYTNLLPTNYNNKQTSNNFNILQNGQKKSQSKSGYLGLNMSVEIDSFNLLAAQGSSNFGNTNNNDFQNSMLMGGSNQQYKSNINGNGLNNGFDAGINWQISSRKNKSRLVTLSYQFLLFNNTQNNDVALLDKINFTAPSFKQKNDALNREHTAQIDLVQGFKKIYVEAGVKAIFRNHNSNFESSNFNNLLNIYQPDSLGSNEFLSTQNILGAYNNYRFVVGSWNLQAGFRIEQTRIQANFLNNATSISQNYLNVIPNISINKELKNKANINIGFSQRIKRPGINRLNPFVDRTNPNFESTGNPNLKPVINNDIMIGYSVSKKISYNIGVSYSFSNNIDLKVSTFNPTTKITSTIFQNTGKASRLGIDYNVNYTANNKLNMSVNGNIANFWINGFADSTNIENNMFTYYFAFNASYQFKNNWQANAEINAISQNPTGLQNVTNGFVGSSISVSKSILNNKLSFSAYANNIFSKFRDNNTTSFGNNFHQSYNVVEYFRSFGFNINYKFGRLNGELKRNKRAIRNNDLSN